MSTIWNPKNPLKYIKMRLESPSTRGATFTAPMLDLDAAVRLGHVRVFSQFMYIGEWYADQGVHAIFSDVHSGLVSLHQAVHFQLAATEVMAANHFAFPKSAGHVFEYEVVLHLARSITLGCETQARRFATLFYRDPEMMYLNKRMTRTPPYLFNLYSQWAGLPLPPRLAALKVEEPYAEVLAVWRSTDLNEIRRALILACDFHIARSRNHNNKESFEFCDLDFRLQPVEILALLRLREMSGLENPAIDHPVMQNPAGKLYPIIHVEPDPIIAPALKVALRQIEEEKREGNRD